MNHTNNTLSIITMSAWMFIIGFLSVNTILPKNTTNHLNKVFMALQMVFLMNTIEFFMIKKYDLMMLFIMISLIITYIIKNQIFHHIQEENNQK